ncbi:MAG: hypothetical protein M1274_03075 [Actinobacteria bacterium]|nr:hypothetical protein [Actinomycetota bacterium]
MRLRVVILVLTLLTVAALSAACGNSHAGVSITVPGPMVPSQQAGEIVVPDTGGAAASAPAGNTLTTSSTIAGIRLPTIAPLNRAFLDSLLLPMTDASTIATVGHALGLRPLSQDFLYARGIHVPTLSELGLPPLGPGQELPEVLPSSYDLRTEERVTPVGDQNPYGTCWSFATLGSLESWLLPDETWNFSEDNMVLNSQYDVGDDPYNHGGNIEMSTAYLVRWGGPVEESSDEYGDSYTPAGLSPVKHVQEVNWIPARGGPLDNDNVKRAVMQFGGVYITLSWQDSSSGSMYFDASSASYYYNGPLWANHAVLVIGWDDDYPASNFPMQPSGDGAFLIKNSWGTDFGDAGYFWVSYY